jgi:predicted O-methyltransferase YrrM
MKEGPDRILRPEQAAYLDTTVAPRDALLAKMEAYAAQHGHPISDPEVASLIAAIARLRAPRVIVEVGTNIGYGAIVLARAVAAVPGARVVTVEKNEALCKVARDFVAEAGLGASVDVVCDDALAFLDKLEGDVGLAYIDCVKQDYPRYLDLLTPKLEANGVILADNVLWKGFVAAPAPPPEEVDKVTALREFNRRVTQAPFSGVILPLGDGVAFATKA